MENGKRDLEAGKGQTDAMNPRITMVTLGVEDLERAVAFFDLKGGLRLALWPRQSIAKDAGVALQPPSATELTLAHNMPSKEGVDLVMEQARRAGATAAVAVQRVLLRVLLIGFREKALNLLPQPLLLPLHAPVAHGTVLGGSAVRGRSAAGAVGQPAAGPLRRCGWRTRRRAFGTETDR